MSELTPDLAAALIRTKAPQLNQDAHGAGHGDKPDAPKGWHKLIRRGKDAGGGQGGPPKVDQGFTVLKESLIKTDSSGSKDSAEENRIRRGTQDEDRNRIKIPEHLRNEYVAIVSEYAGNLINVQKHHPELFRLPGHARERLLLDKFTGDDGKVNLQSIEDFIKSDGSGEGMALTTMIIQQQLSYQAFGLGLDVATRDLDHYPTPNELVGTRADQFVTRHRPTRWLRDRPWAARLAGTTVGAAVVGTIGGVGTRGADNLARTLGSMATNFGWSPGWAGALGGAVAGGGAGYLMADMYSADGRMNLEACGDVLNMLQNPANAGEAAYLRAMTGVDVSHYVAHGNVINRVRPNINTTGERHHVQNAERMVSAHREFMETLGYPSGRQGRSIDFALSRFESGSRYKLVTTWEHRVKEILDRDFPNHIADPRDQQAAQIMQARGCVMDEMLEEQGVRNNDRGKNTQRRLDTIQDGLDRVRSDEQWKKAHKDRADVMTGDKELLDKTAEGLKKEKKPEGLDFDASEKTLNEEYSRAGRSVNDDIMMWTQMLDVNAATVGGTPNFAEQRAKAIQDYDLHIKAITRDYDPRYIDPSLVYPRGGGGNNRPSVAVSARSEEVERARADRDAKLAQISASQNEIKVRLETLESFRDKKQKIQQLTDTKDRDKMNTQVTADYTFMHDSLHISDDNLRDRPIEDLLYIVNMRAASTPPVVGSWPAEQNNIEVYRRRLLHAKTEAIARQLASGPRGGTNPPTHEHRLRAIQSITEPMDDTIEIERALAKLERPQDIADQGEIVLDAAKRESEIIHRTFSTDENEFSMARITDINAPTPADDNLTTQEWEVVNACVTNGININRAHLELYQQIFGYQDKPDRGEYFRRLQGVISIQEMNGVLWGSGLYFSTLLEPARVRLAELQVLDTLYDNYSIALTT